MHLTRLDHFDVALKVRKLLTLTVTGTLAVPVADGLIIVFPVTTTLSTTLLTRLCAKDLFFLLKVR